MIQQVISGVELGGFESILQSIFLFPACSFDDFNAT